MTCHAKNVIAVIFVAQLTGNDPDGYNKAAEQMVALAQRQSGYVGMDSTRNESGLGITVSYWADDESAQDWRDQPDHAAIRDKGRAIWYESYSLHVAKIERSYDWEAS